MGKPILCLDFDGVLHSYTSGWKGAAIIPDPPVAGALAFLHEATKHFKVAIFSSRSIHPDGRRAMREWLGFWSVDEYHGLPHDTDLSFFGDIEWPLEKPPALVTIDDRAICFDGTWPTIELLKTFQPWNKRPLGATGTFPQGQLSDDDQGGLKIGVAYDKLNGIVRLEFGKPVAWIGLPPAEAIQFGKLLMEKAGAKKIEVTI